MKKILTHIEMSRKGGKAGTGATKARTSKQARKAALARWRKRDTQQMKHFQNSALGYVARTAVPIIFAVALLCGCREKEKFVEEATAAIMKLQAEKATNSVPAGHITGIAVTNAGNFTHLRNTNALFCNNIAIGSNAGFYTFSERNFIAIGNNAQPSNSFELVIRFRSGKEFRMALPTNDPVALDWFVER